MRKHAGDHDTEKNLGHSGTPRRIVVVTPAYNEETYLPRVGATVFAQTLKPSLWVIVDDGSSDETLHVANRLAEGQSWIKITRKERDSEYADKSFTAFNFGVGKIGLEWHYLVKLDADTALPQDFLARLADRFESNPDIGIASGVCRGEPGLRSHPRGNNRMYRRECWDEITFPDDGFGWDTVDEAFARLNGWRALAFDDLVCEHMKSKLLDAGYRFHQGRLSRHVGYYWWFAAGRAVKMLASFGPVASLAYFAGYLRGGFDHVSRSVEQVVRADQRRRVMNALGPRSRSP